MARKKEVKRLRYRCRTCGFKTKLSEIEAEARMICPECHWDTLYEEHRVRGPGVVSVRPGVIRSLIARLMGLFWKSD
jgi:DNA-directed RNA polymerase subunit RPC12/RpoP